MQIAKLPLQSIQSVSEAKPVAGNLSLAGLAPGNYVLEARLDLGDTVIVRTHAFRMEGRTFAQPAASSNWFQSVSDERLAELFDAVAGTLQKQSDRELYERLNPDGRRRFLAQYFGVTGPSPEGSPKNALDHYLERAAHVNSTYTSRVGEPGWKTDRGRVYLLRGEPQAKVARPLPPGGAAPYEVWHFTSAPGYAYVFIDESRVGSYRLIWTSDPNEASLPDWDRRLSAEALEEMFRMGIRPPRTGGGSDRE
jgi:GWxTD domain-containing protein